MFDILINFVSGLHQCAFSYRLWRRVWRTLGPAGGVHRTLLGTKICESAERRLLISSSAIDMRENSELRAHRAASLGATIPNRASLRRRWIIAGRLLVGRVTQSASKGFHVSSDIPHIQPDMNLGALLTRGLCWQSIMAMLSRISVVQGPMRLGFWPLGLVS